MGIVTGYLSQLVSSGIKLLNNGTAVSSSNTAGFTEINSELRIDFFIVGFTKDYRNAKWGMLV
jgi:hypothetical protein